MKFLKTIRAWWRGLFRKRRFNMLNATDNTEEWHMHLSPASILAGLVAFMLMLFILTLSLVAYSPILEFLPGYRTEADRSRESLVQNIIRLDSMERMMNDMLTYNENIALIMEGRTPVARVLASSDSSRISKVLVMPSHEDSLLRAQMEGDGEYAIAGQGGSRRKVREAIELATPVEGIITGKFDIRQGNFGVKIAATAADRITAIDNGTVVQSLWTPETKTMLSKYSESSKNVNNIESVVGQLMEELGAGGFMGIQDILPGMKISVVTNTSEENGTSGFVSEGEVVERIDDELFVTLIPENGTVMSGSSKTENCNLRIIVNNTLYNWKDAKITAVPQRGTDCYKLVTESNPAVMNRRKYTRMSISNTCTVTFKDNKKSYNGHMVNISANGFAFSCTDEVFADAKGKEIAISIPDFSIVSARNLTGVIIRSSNNDGEYIVGCRMPEDHLQIKEYIEHR